MATRVLAILLWSSCIALPTFAQEEGSAPARPSVFGSTYTVTISPIGQITQKLHEENGVLTLDKKFETGDWSSDSVKYESVNYVSLGSDYVTTESRKRTVEIGDSDGRTLIVTLRTEAEARTVVDYVVPKSPLHLELIAGAWRSRMPFECSDDTQPGCKDFKELLDHNDPDIAGYFYARGDNNNVYACFSGQEASFFVVGYTHYGKCGIFSRSTFKNGQSDSNSVNTIDWSSGDAGSITEKLGQKTVIVGGVDSSSLFFQSTFTNKMSTKTDYELRIRWSTGRYTENFSFKDPKGQPFNSDSSGRCVKLH